MPKTFRSDRRRFLRGAVLTATALPAGGYVMGFANPAWAEDRPRAEDGHAWDYVNDAADADSELYEDGQLCSNCVFWTGEVEDGWGGCQHPDFEDVLVNAEGWCSAYVALEA